VFRRVIFIKFKTVAYEKALIAASAAIILAAGAAACWTMYSGSEYEFFNENLEVLMDSEIIVGDLCMVCPNYACTTLGEVLEDHYPA